MKRERERTEFVGGRESVMRDTIFLGGGKNVSGSESSQAVHVRPPGRGMFKRR
jgi:hypothetical protein